MKNMKPITYPWTTIGELVFISIFVPIKMYKLLQEKKQIEEANPERKLEMQEVPGWLGFPRRSWGVEETRTKPATPPTQPPTLSK